MKTILGETLKHVTALKTVDQTITESTEQNNYTFDNELAMTWQISSRKSKQSMSYVVK